MPKATVEGGGSAYSEDNPAPVEETPAPKLKAKPKPAAKAAAEEAAPAADDTTE